ncbi:SCO family protein [Roseibacillus ishigakijimensis]|uniref:SCO family protein n=1 Tax=Roseibacillus ishigakijimensis TaxID=454146 RepID=A0A934RUB5_9BACT|nr:SCO family protein [Roseibacillus ishigakijimensis]MBK1835164.1 SCO family protein [Roseibacillus ishigakijimensis]
MTDKTKITLIYVGIAVFAAFIVTMFIIIGNGVDRTLEEDNRIATDVGREQAQEMLRLENDLVATNQAGDEVRLSELKDKVWIMAQFFAACPNCAARNGDHLVKLYQEYKDNPDFHVVCVTVDPETDDPARLQEYAETLGADISDWWFLTGDHETLHHYMEEEMKFLAVRERVKQEDIDREGRYAHDMGVAVFGKGLVMKEKKDLLFARQQGPELYEHFEGLLTKAIEEALAQ